MKLELLEDTFVRELAQEVTVPGVQPGYAIDGILSQHLAASIKSFIGERLIKPPTIKLRLADAQDNIVTLPVLAQRGYTTWYPEICFSTKPSDLVDNIIVEPAGISLGKFAQVNGITKQCNIKIIAIKTQTNHILKFQGINIEGRIFERVIDALSDTSLENPYIAN